MARKKKHEEHENHERWLISYADFITLLFAFFVVMYSLSAINEGKFRVLSEALSAAFRSTPKSMEPIQFGRPSKPDMVENRELNRSASVAVPTERVVALPNKPFFSKEREGHDGTGEGKSGAAGDAAGEAMREIARQMEEAFAPLIRSDLVAVRRFRYWVEVEIKSHILFPSGQAEFEPHAIPVLKQIAVILRGYPNPIHIEGYTDNVPIKTALFPSNWELSSARATSVVHLFARAGIQSERMAAVGYGEFKPSAPNDTDEGRTKNRRVVLVILATEDTKRLRDMTEPAPSGPATTAAPAAAARDG